MTDSMRDRLRDELAGWDIGIGSGYYSTTVGVDDARDMADALLAAVPWLADEPTEQEVETGARALRESEMVHEDVWYAPWDELTDRAKDERRDVVRAVLVAARGTRTT